MLHKGRKIAIYMTSSELGGGVNRIASILATELVKLGYDITIISLYKGKKSRYISDSRIKLYELFERPYSLYITAFIAAYKIRRYVRRHNIDVLISCGAVFFTTALFAKTKHIAWDHTSFYWGNKITMYCRQLALKYASKVIVLTNDSKQGCLTLSPQSQNIQVIYNMIDTAACDIQANMDSKIVISIGNLNFEKGYDLLIKAWDMTDAAVRDGWQLYIVGKDEGVGHELQQTIDRSDLNHQVKLLGFRSDVKELLASSSIFAFSSRHEGMPMVLLEAQACGLPIVSFDCKTGPAEILTPECGVLVENGNITKLASSMSMLMCDIDLRKQLSSAALLNIERFKSQNIIKQWIEVIEND